MRIRTLVVALAVATPLLAIDSGPAAACGWLFGGGYGYSAPVGYGYAPRTYGYYGYAPRYYGGFYGRRLGWRGYGWRGYGYRAWGGRRVGYGLGFRGARVGAFRGGWRR